MKDSERQLLLLIAQEMIWILLKDEEANDKLVNKIHELVDKVEAE